MKMNSALTLGIICLLLTSCEKSYNEKMTELIMNKRELEDSIEFIKNIQYVAQIKLDTVELDSTILKELIKIDTTLTDAQAKITINNYNNNINRIESKLNKVVNSMDSLEKMK